MKHLKMLGLFAMAAAALMAFAGSASAATFTAPAGTAYTGKVSSSLEGGTATLKAGFFTDTCTGSTVAGELTTNNETHATGPTTNVSFTGCTFTTKTLSSTGTLTIAKSNTAVTGTGTEVTTSAFGVSCIYGLGSTGTSLGTAKNTASGVTLAISTKLPLIKQEGSGFTCASPAEWTANYVITTPTGSVVE
jgi:hypothetical protein